MATDPLPSYIVLYGETIEELSEEIKDNSDEYVLQGGVSVSIYTTEDLREGGVFINREYYQAMVLKTKERIPPAIVMRNSIGDEVSTFGDPH